MRFMNNFWNMENNKYYSCDDFVIHRVNNELFVNGNLMYTFVTHDLMGNPYKKGPFGRLSASNTIPLEGISRLVSAMDRGEIINIH